MASAGDKAHNVEGATANLVHTHPLNPLSLEEMAAVAHAFKIHALQGEFGIKSFKFVAITLQEPDKNQVFEVLGIPAEPLEFGHASPSPVPLNIPREAYAIAIDHSTGRAYESIIVLSDACRVSSFTQLAADVQPGFSIQELLDTELIVKKDATVQKLCSELGLSMDQVFCDGWSIGHDKRWPAGLRVHQCMMFVRPHGLDSNLYGYPLDFVPIVDVNASQVLRIDWPLPRLPGVRTSTEPTPLSDTSVPTARSGYPDTPSEYLPDFLERIEGLKMRDDIKPIHITQPEGVSFQLRGHQLEWQKYSMHIGFNYREGLVINTVTYNDTDNGRGVGQTLRPLFYRMSIAEMIVPYGDPGFPHHRKMVFDAGEYGLGMMANSLALGCDCKGSIAYLDAHLPTADGAGTTVKNAVCIHEEDVGLAWKHVDYRTGRSHTVRMRKLVVSCVYTLANYEYGVYFNFFQDGSIQAEIKLTGVLHTIPLGEGEKPGLFGTEVAPRVNAPNHQHIFSLRVDPMVDGRNNSLVQNDIKLLGTPTGDPSNYLGNAFTNVKTVLSTSQHADYDVTSGRSWTITNPSRKHYSSESEVGYKIVCKDYAPLFTTPDSLVALRAPFARHNVWVVPYADDKRYPGGLHVPQTNHARDGIDTWVGKKGMTKNTDVVTYITFAANHIPRPEDFPVMPVESVSVWLKPSHFFRRNPALDVPQESDEKSKYATAYTQEAHHVH
ncbi:hypothetical protein K439DRAFT_1134852 [Ramaria rubella]|nr:hypothetical protein K439DRAFT_1134852 [Ramaria rubella]